MKNNGFWASFEAMLSLLVLVAIIVSIPETEQPSMQNLYILQKEHDLLKVWAKQGLHPMEEMVSDTKFAFPNKSFEIRANDKAKRFGESSGEERVSASLLFFDSKMQKTEVTLVVFK